MADDLNRPLGLAREPASRFVRPVAWLPLAFGGLVMVAVALVAFVVITGDRNAGEPFALARIEPEKPTYRSCAGGRHRDGACTRGADGHRSARR